MFWSKLMSVLRCLLPLLLIVTPVAAKQFTVRCERDSYYFLTFDTETNRMASETVQGGSYRGEIESMSDTEIVFIQPIAPKATLHYVREEGAVDVQTDKLLRSFVNCIPAPTHDILSKWEMLR
jgi:hypothetical protein